MIAVVLGGLLTLAAISSRDANEALASSAPQQTVVALWALGDFALVLILEVTIGAVAAASYAFWRGSVQSELVAPAVSDADAPTGRHEPADLPRENQHGTDI